MEETAAGDLMPHAQVRLQHHDLFAGCVHVRRAGKTLADAVEVLIAHRQQHPWDHYRLAALDRKGWPVPIAEPFAQNEAPTPECIAR